jgi:hypothetical protein
VDQYTFYGVPSITSVTPNNGPIAGGTTVTIVGNNLAAERSVYFGSVAAPVSYNSNSEIIVTAPAEAAGSVYVEVSVPEGTTELQNAYTYEAPVMTSLGVSVFGAALVRTEVSTMTVTALDQYGFVFAGYRGMVKFTSTSAASSLPQAYTFVSGDAGVHTFNVALGTMGTQSITATDTLTASINGTETGIVVGDAIWVVNGNGTLSKLLESGTLLTGPVGSTNGGGLGAVAFDSTGDAWSVSAGDAVLSEAGPLGTGATTHSGGGLSSPVSVAVDGKGYVWVANGGSGSVSEFSSAGAAVTGSNGYGEAAIGSGVDGMALDASGGVWVVSKTAGAVTHVVGVATPVVVPMSKAVTNVTVGTKP